MKTTDKDVTNMIEMLREEAAKSIERMIAQKLNELEFFKDEAIKNAENIVAEKIQQIEGNPASFEDVRLYRWDENGLWVTPKSVPVPPPLPASPPVNSTFPPPPPVRETSTTSTSKTTATIAVKMPALNNIASVTKNQIKSRPIKVKDLPKKYKKEWSWNVLFVIFALEFALGFGICHWWWSQWESNQPKIILKPNEKGIFVSPESLRAFYDEININVNPKQIETLWNNYKTKFTQFGSTVESQFDESRNNFLIRIDDWVIHIKFVQNKISEKALILFFGDQISVFKTIEKDNRIRVYLLDSVRFNNTVAKTESVPLPPKQSQPPLAQPTIHQASITETENGFHLTRIRPEAAQVGSGRALFKTFSSFQRAFERSINAHAPSQYVFRLERKWKTFKSIYGLKFDTKVNEANCVFIVNGDDKELFRSGEIHDAEEHFVELDISNIDKLELRVDSASDNTNNQAVWFSPILLQ
jgi:hypothetical protein